MRDHGIDYGMGATNVGEHGIRYGVIPLHALAGHAVESFEDDYGPATCGRCGAEAVEYDDETHGSYERGPGCSDYACADCARAFSSDNAFGDEPIGSTLDDGEYRAELHGDGDVFVLSSPYYTHARYCSPCAPGACYLESPTDDTGPRAFCFGPDWFEDDRAPYPIYRVSDDVLVYDPDEPDEPEEPDEGDYTSSDHLTWFQHGKAVLRLADGEDHVAALRAHMDEAQWWPNAWWISDHGNAHRIEFSPE